MKCKYQFILKEKIHGDTMGYNHLISLYAHIGDKNEMMRLQISQKNASKKQINRDYITMKSSLVKLGDVETAEALKALIMKAEAILRNIVQKGKKPTPKSWSIVSAGYLNFNNMAKAFECMKEALSVIERNVKWIPKPAEITTI